MLGFEVQQYTTEQEFKDIILPDMVEIIQRTGELNFLLVYNGDFGGFRMGQWLKEAMVKLHSMPKWKQVAIITSTHVVKSLLNLSTRSKPGEFRGFNEGEMQEAIDWIGPQVN